MRRAAPVLLLVAAALVAAPPASATTFATCSFDPAQHRLSVAADADGQNPSVGRSGTAIVVKSGGLAITCAGGSPTVTNTDKIEITDSSLQHNSFTVDLSGGPARAGRR